MQILDVLGGAGRVRWGLDGEHRADWGIDPDYGLNSWAWGIDQLMMGVALGDDLRLAPLPGQEPHVDPQVHTALAVGGVPPLALGEGSIAAAGRIGAAVKALQGVHRLLGDGLDRTIEDWCERLRTVVDLMLEPARFQEWQRIALDKALDSLICESRDLAGDPSSLKVGFADFRRLISPVIEGRRARVNMAHGTVRVSRPGIFAGVPHKVVCLLGLDADSLPTATTASDNLADSSEWVGDQDARLRARADLLAAVMSARSHLVVTYTGTDVRNNQPVPPAVVLEEFTEELASCLGVTPGQVREESLGIFVTHSRQAFDSKNFVIGDQRLRPLSYDPVALQGALARTLAGQGQLEARPILLDHALDLPAAEPGVVDLAELLSFYSHPVKAFFNTSLGVKLQERSDGQDEELPTSISGLDTASIGRALLSAGLMADDLDKILISIDSDFEFGGLELSRILEVPLATGVLPPPAIADRELPAISEEVAELLHFAESLNVRRATTCSQPIDIRLPSGVRLLGSVEDCLDGPLPGPIDIRFARARPFHRIRQGIQLLALTANDPTTIWRGVLITRGARTGAKSVQIVRTVLGHEVAIRQEVAMDALDALIAQYRDGLSCALPLFDNTSMARSNGSSISSPWGTAHGKYAQGESTDPYHKQAFGTLQTADLTQLSVAGFTLDSEAKRLWGTIDSAIVDPAVNDPELSDSTIGE
ncbi:MAG TPA: hypothetical protein VL068_12485, partial [Microthrixaceae bacterium]|nr:hypothetical protein [Microthrixaceae bacterium]